MARQDVEDRVRKLDGEGRDEHEIAAIVGISPNRVVAILDGVGAGTPLVPSLAPPPREDRPRPEKPKPAPTVVPAKPPKPVAVRPVPAEQDLPTVDPSPAPSAAPACRNKAGTHTGINRHRSAGETKKAQWCDDCQAFWSAYQTDYAARKAVEHGTRPRKKVAREKVRVRWLVHPQGDEKTVTEFAVQAGDELRVVPYVVAEDAADAGMRVFSRQTTHWVQAAPPTGER